MFDPETEVMESLEFAQSHVESIDDGFVNSFEELGRRVKFGPGPVMDRIIELADSSNTATSILGVRLLGLVCGPVEKVLKVLEEKKTNRSVKVSIAARESIMRLIPIKMIEEAQSKRGSGGILNPHALRSMPNI